MTDLMECYSFSNPPLNIDKISDSDNMRRDFYLHPGPSTDFFSNTTSNSAQVTHSLIHLRISQSIERIIFGL